MNGTGVDKNDDDRLVWRHVTRGVRPLPREKGLFPADAAQPDRPSRQAQKPPRAQKAVPAAPPDEKAGQSRPVSRAVSRPGAAAGPVQQHPGTGLDRRSDRKLRRGEWEIDGRIDLHGLSRDRAYEALVRFIIGAQGAGKRCVLVITGKGRGGQPGVIRAHLPLWLDGPPLGGLVLRYYTARPADGGEGAFYVLLRRTRE